MGLLKSNESEEYSRGMLPSLPAIGKVNTASLFSQENNMGTENNEGSGVKMHMKFHEIIADDQAEELTERGKGERLAATRKMKYEAKDCFDEVSGGINFPTDENQDDEEKERQEKIDLR